MYSTASSMSLKPSLQLCRCIPLDPDGGADHMSRGGNPSIVSLEQIKQERR
jgi:hypothetical protein